jgi:putative membrane protein
MSFIFHLLINAAVILGMTYILPTVTIKNYTTALLVALVIAVLNATIGLLIRFPINVITLGLISFVIHLFVTAIMIKLADLFFKDFKVRGFTPALIIAVVMALVGLIF